MNNGDMPVRPTYSPDGRLLNLKEGYNDDSILLDEGTNFAIGLTKREEFASRNMAKMLVSPDYAGDSYDTISGYAIEAANSLLKALEKEQGA